MNRLLIKIHRKDRKEYDKGWAEYGLVEDKSPNHLAYRLQHISEIEVPVEVFHSKIGKLLYADYEEID